MAQSSSCRKVYLDILRVIASFLVCYNHTFGYHLFLSQEASGSLLSWINVVLPILTIMDVPLFFMISGALLIGKEESYSTLLRKRVWRFLVVLFAASGITYLIMGKEPRSVSAFIYSFFRGEVNGSHWYLCAYLGFLLMLPFLRKIAKHLSGKDILYLVLLRVVFVSGLISLNFFFDCFGLPPIVLSNKFSLPLALSEFLFYPIVGYYLADRLPMERIGAKEIGICFTVLIAGSAFSAIITYIQGMRSSFSQDYLGLFNYTSPMAFFIIVRYFVDKIAIPEKLSKFFRAVSSVSIGIYLAEPLVVHSLSEPFFRPIPWHPVTITVFSVLWCFCCMAIGGSITHLLRKIPGVNRFL